MNINAKWMWVLFPAILLMPLAGVTAQDGFGFGDSDFGFGSAAVSSFTVNIGGEVKTEIKGFFEDMGSADKIKNYHTGDIFSGNLNFDAAGSSAQGIIKLKLTPSFNDTPPVELDEAFLRAFFGPVTIEGGLRKLTWGKADSFGPLDLVNPLDYTDITKLSDPQSIKIARPMIHAAWSLGTFTKLEGVFIPWFQGHKFTAAGRWTPRQIVEMRDGIHQIIAQTAYEIQMGPITGDDESKLLAAIKEIGGSLEDGINNGTIYPETSTLEYAQGGLRFTTSIGSSDIGFQYYFGRLPRPAVSGINPQGFFTPSGDLHPEAITPAVYYNWYHHIGTDYAMVISGFNLRAEAGVNITEDRDGTDGTVENPALVWSLGFDRHLFLGININLQGTGKIRLFHDEISDNPLIDCEAGSSRSSTRITGILSKKFFQDELELKTTGLWGIEDKDFLIMPAIIWSRNDVSVQLSAGFFGGDRKGELGQYRDNGFLRMILSYEF